MTEKDVADKRLRLLQSFFQEIGAESDRGLALIASAFIDEILKDTLQAFFCFPAPHLLVGKHAPLGTFSARIEMCHALGLIDDVERNDCDYIRRIRNEFAHRILIASFLEGNIRDLCGNFLSELPEPAEASITEPRLKFTNAITSMAVRLLYRDLYVAREKRHTKVWVKPEEIAWRRVSEQTPPEGVPVIAVHWPVAPDTGQARDKS